MFDKFINAYIQFHKRIYHNLFLIVIIIGIVFGFVHYHKNSQDVYFSIIECDGFYNEKENILSFYVDTSVVFAITDGENFQHLARYIVMENTDPSVISFDTYDDTIVVYAKKPGMSTLTYNIKGNLKDKAVINIEVLNDRLSIESPQGNIWIDMYVGESLKTTIKSASGQNYNNSDIKYTIDDESIVTVDKNGVIKALKSGITKITAERLDGYSECKTKTIIVSYKEIPFKSGDIVDKPKGNRNAKISFNTKSMKKKGKVVYVYLKNKNKKSNSVGFVLSKNKTTQVKVPTGTYDLYLAQGKYWYGKLYKLGDDIELKKKKTIKVRKKHQNHPLKINLGKAKTKSKDYDEEDDDDGRHASGSGSKVGIRH
ncbi:MAG: Ig-like domain-containing protein [Erysipelotrichaceae bacterium]|nr:Ig-like domain-containing protein [Erysipelotrichaceae bacterium]